MDPIRIVVVDDHPLFRQGVVDALSLEPGLRVIGQVGTGPEALELVRRELPDVAVLDVNLPELNGQQVTRQLTLEKVATRVILLTAYDDVEQVIHAIRAGAMAYCSKDVEPSTLVTVIEAVMQGNYYVGNRTYDKPGIERWLEEQTERAVRPYSEPGEPFHPLSGREMEVLESVTQGKSNKEIATDLGISHQTVKNHVTAILRKLGVDDRTQAAVYALKRGWVRLYKQDGSSGEE
ncbi:MAG: response regulator transcription factor [Anaerolineae bacterium]|nr:MAG: response regulator transcription factor [Anaerolineae bacterium]